MCESITEYLLSLLVTVQNNEADNTHPNTSQENFHFLRSNKTEYISSKHGYGLCQQCKLGKLKYIIKFINISKVNGRSLKSLKVCIH